MSSSRQGASSSTAGPNLRLSVGSSFGRYSPLNPISSEAEPPQSNSASLTKAQREIKGLKEENMRLRKELADMSSLYNQLVKESKHENYDERRVSLLKSQVVQLERQILLLSEALGSRSAVLLEVENALAAIADNCRGYLAAEGRIGEVLVTRADMQNVVETAESARIKLYKNIENTSAQRLERPLSLMSDFIRPDRQEAITLLDICSGKLDYLSLKHVAKLESKLSQTYTLLKALHQSLLCVSSHDQNGKPLRVNQEVPKASFERLSGQVVKLSNLLKDVNSDLLELTLLVPSAPWPVLRRGFNPNVSTEQVMRRLSPNTTRSKMNEMQKVVDCLLKAVNYTVHMSQAEAKVAQEELRFHKAVYNLQLQYSDSLFQALQEGYVQFEENANEILCKPLSEILRVYEHLKLTASEDGLRRFLATFKQHADQISEAVTLLSPTDNKGRGEAISSFGRQFYDSLTKLTAECRQKRDNLVNDLELVQGQREQHVSDLEAMFDCGRTLNKRNESVDEEVPNDTTTSETSSPEVIVSKLKTSPAKSNSSCRLFRSSSESSLCDPGQNGAPENCSCHAQHRQTKQPSPKLKLDDRPPWSTDFAPESAPDDLSSENPTPVSVPALATDDREPWNENFAAEFISSATDSATVSDKPPKGASSKSRTARRESKSKQDSATKKITPVAKSRLVLKPRGKGSPSTNTPMNRSGSWSGSLSEYDRETGAK